MEYLSYDEQFKDILNLEQIQRIKDDKLRNIRLKYWNKWHDAFCNEHGVSDSKLGEAFDEIKKQEKLEIEKYKIKCGLE